MKILGISSFYHDSAAAIIVDGEIVAAAQEERFTRKKHDPAFPIQAIQYCLEHTGLTLDDLDAIAFYEKPFLKFERLLETYYSFAPRGFASFLTAIPVWLREKLFIKKVMLDELEKIGNFNRKKATLLFPEHHLSHAASAFYPSPFEKSAVLTVDGVGEWATASISLGEGNQFTVLKELQFPHSLGLLYSAFTYFLGFRVNSGEYKLMGLAPYGNPHSPTLEAYKTTIRTELMDIKPDGSIWLNQKYFNYATGLRMVFDKKWERLFGFPRRESEAELESHHCDLALAIQHITEEVLLLMAHEAKKITGAENLCLAGGVALNCVANGKIKEAGIFKNVYIQPASGDAGGALGAALVSHYIHFDQPRNPNGISDTMHGAYLGPGVSDEAVVKMAKTYAAQYGQFDSVESLCDQVAQLLDQNQVIGWMQGRMEFGPRALGNRSILGDPRSEEMQKKINLKIKYRESFRPFAPSVLAEDANLFFELKGDSPYMLLVHPVKEERRKPVPENYDSLGLREKLYQPRSDVPSITHIDFSARIQTVHEETNPRYWQLLSAFKQLTGMGMLINTSFNVRGEPIVCSPEDAYRCFMRTEMDYLVIGNFLFDKKKQPDWKSTDDWKEEFVLD